MPRLLHRLFPLLRRLFPLRRPHRTALVRFIFEAIADRTSGERRGLFRYEPIAALIADHEANRVDGTDRLLSLLNLEIWHRQYA